jgi:hypothetical protein
MLQTLHILIGDLGLHRAVLGSAHGAKRRLLVDGGGQARAQLRHPAQRPLLQGVGRPVTLV